MNSPEVDLFARVANGAQSQLRGHVPPTTRPATPSAPSQPRPPRDAEGAPGWDTAYKSRVPAPAAESSVAARPPHSSKVSSSTAAKPPVGRPRPQKPSQPSPEQAITIDTRKSLRQTVAGITQNTLHSRKSMSVAAVIMLGSLGIGIYLGPKVTGDDTADTPKSPAVLGVKLNSETAVPTDLLDECRSIGTLLLAETATHTLPYDSGKAEIRTGSSVSTVKLKIPVGLQVCNAPELTTAADGTIVQTGKFLPLGEIKKNGSEKSLEIDRSAIAIKSKGEISAACDPESDDFLCTPVYTEDDIAKISNNPAIPEPDRVRLADMLRTVDPATNQPPASNDKFRAATSAKVISQALTAAFTTANNGECVKDIYAVVDKLVANSFSDKKQSWGFVKEAKMTFKKDSAYVSPAESYNRDKKPFVEDGQVRLQPVAEACTFTPETGEKK